MRRWVAGGTVALFGLAGWLSLAAQSQAPADLQPTSTAPPAAVVSVPAGEVLVLELRDSLNTQTTRKGDQAEFTTTSEILLGHQVAVPRGATVRATVTESKRPGRLIGRAQIRLEFNELVLSEGTVLPLAAKLSRAGWWEPSGKIEQTVKGERSAGRDIVTVGRGAAEGAIIGGISGGRKGAGTGAAAGAIISAVLILLERGPDLDLPPGMMFEIELTKPLEVPAPAGGETQVASTELPSLPLPAAPHPEAQGTDSVMGADSAAAAPEPGVPPLPDAPASDVTAVATNRTPPPPPATPPPAPDSTPVAADAGGFTLKVEVDLVLVEATVRDRHGRIVDDLKREDFRPFEDGVEQEIRHFSQDELPLAVALVVDRSGSIASVLTELRQAALGTLALLKPEDQVALFAFDSKTERLEFLTDDRDRIADRIGSIAVGGGTNITDALFDAALYLGRAAHGRRHAVILVSDNQGTVRGHAGDGKVIRTALETETVIYSVKIGSAPHTGMLNLPLWGAGSVKKIARETGGEIIDVDRVGSLTSALTAVITRLKQRYTLGYQTSNKRRDGSFRKIDIRLADRFKNLPDTYTIYARRGYYAPKERTTARSAL